MVRLSVVLAACSRLVAPVAFLSIASLLGPSVAAQGKGKKSGSQPPPPVVTPLCLNGCVTYSVSVTPDGGVVTNIPNTTDTVTFTVQNTGTGADEYTIACSATGGVTCVSLIKGGGINAFKFCDSCGALQASALPLVQPLCLHCGGVSDTLYENAGQSRGVSVVYTVGASGGTVTLSASGNAPEDDGFYNVSVYGPPVVALRNANGDNLDRSLCLTSGAGEAAGWECGDLIVTHGLPGYATMGHERSLSLLYNSATAAPHPVVAAVVTEPAGTGASTVFAELLINGVYRDSASFTGWTGAPLTRQIALTYDASGDTTGAYPFTLILANRYAFGSYTDTLTGTVLVVNRTQSQLGAGWAFEGVERLYFNQPTGASNGSILWVGGDGSAKLYAPAGTNKWVAPAGEYRDTLYYNTGTSTYTDTLRHKVVVTFDVSGRHTMTTNRVGQSSTFHWNASGQLDTIAVPPSGVTGTKYSITYTGGKLSALTDPIGRALGVTVTSNRLTSISDPDFVSTGFGYDASGRMTSRTTRRGFTTRYAYAHGVRLTIDSVRVDTIGAASALYATSTFQPWDEQGLATTASGNTAVDTALAYTKIDGPRTDVADTAEFWVDRWGAPLQIRNPLGAITTLVRGNATVPALVTQVTEADGRIAKLTYDNLGNLTQQRDSTSHLGSAGLPTRVTRWTFTADSTKFSPDSEIDSLSSGALITKFVYNRWGLLRDVTGPNGHVTHYDFLTTGSDSGLVRAVTEQQVPAWDTSAKANGTADRRTAFAFDNLGNVTSDTSPMGHVTRYIRDALERITNVYDPRNHHTVRVYDPLNRVIQTEVDTGTANVLVTSFHYNVDVMDSVSDPRGVYRAFRYDAADRRYREFDDYGKPQTSYLDAAGLVDSIRTRMDSTGRPQMIRMTYDANGRMTKQAWPALTAAADSVLYTYDVMGRMLTATSSTRKVARTYFAVGAAKTDIQSLPGDTGRSTLTYTYDRLGRRTFYIDGTVGNTLYSDSVWYNYNAVGDLATIGVRWRQRVAVHNDSVTFAFDPLGRRTLLTYLHGVSVHLAYDADGQLRVVCGIQNPNPQPNGLNNAFAFTHYDATADSDGLVRRTTHSTTGMSAMGCGAPWIGPPPDDDASYDTRHEVLTQSLNTDSAIYTYDASGNRTSNAHVSRAGGTPLTQLEFMDPGHNRLRAFYYTSAPQDSFTISYLANGARITQTPWNGNTPETGWQGSRVYGYDGLGRTTGTAEIVCVSQPGGGCTLEWMDNRLECWYDPLGRLWYPCENGAEKLTYDGDNVTRVGNDSSINSGGNFSIVQGPGIDDPLMEYNDFLGDYYYIVTDGQGRQYGVGDTLGYDVRQDQNNGYDNPVVGGKYAGGGTSMTSFAATRFPNDQAAGLSFFRNRFYDQQTGRWTQEDPIGLAGGLNLYAYVGNDPIGLEDPFGLCDKNTDPTCVTFLDQLNDRITQIWNSGMGALAEDVAGGLKAISSAVDAVLPGTKKVSESLAGSTFDGQRLSGGQQVSALVGGLGEAGMGMAAGGFTEATLAKVSKQLAEHGSGSLLKSLKSLTDRIAEHTKLIEKYKKAGGYTSSMEKEVRAMQGEVNAINHVLNSPP